MGDSIMIKEFDTEFESMEELEDLSLNKEMSLLMIEAQSRKIPHYHEEEIAYQELSNVGYIEF